MQDGGRQRDEAEPEGQDKMAEPALVADKSLFRSQTKHLIKAVLISLGIMSVAGGLTVGAYFFLATVLSLSGIALTGGTAAIGVAAIAILAGAAITAMILFNRTHTEGDSLGVLTAPEDGAAAIAPNQPNANASTLSYGARQMNEAEPERQDKSEMTWALMGDRKFRASPSLIQIDYHRTKFTIRLGDATLNFSDLYLSAASQPTDTVFAEQFKAKLKENGITTEGGAEKSVDRFIKIFCASMHQGLQGLAVIDVLCFLATQNQSMSYPPGQKYRKHKFDVVIERNGNALTGNIQIKSELEKNSVIFRQEEALKSSEQGEPVHFILTASGKISLESREGDDAGELFNVQCTMTASKPFVEQVEAARAKYVALSLENAVADPIKQVPGPAKVTLMPNNSFRSFPTQEALLAHLKGFSTLNLNPDSLDLLAEAARKPAGTALPEEDMDNPENYNSKNIQTRPRRRTIP